MELNWEGALKAGVVGAAEGYGAVVMGDIADSRKQRQEQAAMEREQNMLVWKDKQAQAARIREEDRQDSPKQVERRKQRALEDAANAEAAKQTGIDSQVGRLEGLGLKEQEEQLAIAKANGYTPPTGKSGKPISDAVSLKIHQEAKADLATRIENGDKLLAKLTPEQQVKWINEKAQDLAQGVRDTRGGGPSGGGSPFKTPEGPQAPGAAGTGTAADTVTHMVQSIMLGEMSYKETEAKLSKHPVLWAKVKAELEAVEDTGIQADTGLAAGGTAGYLAREKQAKDRKAAKKKNTMADWRSMTEQERLEAGGG